MEIFAYGFMVKAFFVAILISIITPLIGNIIVLKRLSTVGDALSHASLSGVCVGLVFGINPIFFAVLFSVLAALLIEILRRFFSKYSEVSTAIVMSFAICVTALSSSFIKNATDFNSFLFGSIVAITDLEMYLVVLLSFVVILCMAVLYKPLLYIVFDEEGAAVSGVNVTLSNFVFTVLTAVTVAVSARTVGALIISSLMVLPVACSLLVSKSYKQNMFFAILFAIFFTVCGLFISYYANLKPGGTIVLVGLVTLFFVIGTTKKTG